MSDELKGKKVAIIATNGVEQSELTGPREALEKAGAETRLVSLQPGTIRAWTENNWGQEFKVDVTVEQADTETYDALLIPGGVKNPDTLRANKRAVDLVRAFVQSGKPVAAICHGPWLLVEADVVRGRTLTSYQSIKTDLVNAGAHWVDREVATDQGIVTSRNPGDIPAFSKKFIEEIKEGRHERSAKRKAA